MEEKRIHKVQECILQCAEIEKNVIPIINTCIEAIAKAANSINSEQVKKWLYRGILVPVLDFMVRVMIIVKDTLNCFCM